MTRLLLPPCAAVLQLGADEIEEACSKDQRVAKQLQGQLKKEAVKVAKMEKLAEKKLVADDMQAAMELQAEIEREEAELAMAERRDRKLAAALIKQETVALKQMPETSDELRKLSRSINGKDGIPLRTKLRARLGELKKDVANKLHELRPNLIVQVEPGRAKGEC